MNSWFKVRDASAPSRIPRDFGKVPRSARIIKSEPQLGSGVPFALECPKLEGEGSTPEWEVTARQTVLNILSGAREDAVGILRDAREAAERIKEEAAEQGRAEGLKVGQAQADAVLESLQERVDNAASQLELLQNQLGADQQEVLWARAKALTEWVLGEAFGAHGEILESYLTRVLQSLPEERVSLYLPSGLVERLESWRVKIQNVGKAVRLVSAGEESEAFEHLVVRFDGGGIDAGLRAILEDVGDWREVGAEEIHGESL